MVLLLQSGSYQLHLQLPWLCCLLLDCGVFQHVHTQTTQSPRDTTDPSSLSQLLPMTHPKHKLPCSISDSMECLLPTGLSPQQRWPLSHPPSTSSQLPVYVRSSASWSSGHMWDNFHTLQFLSFKFKSQSHNHLCLYVSLELTHANPVKWHQQKVTSFSSSQNCSSFQTALFLLTLCTILPS